MTRHSFPVGRAGLALARWLLALLACAAASAGHAEVPDRASLVVPPGRFANLETHRLYYHCVGEGTPVVVIDAGIGGAAVEWTPVQNGLRRYTRVCTYDRAGYGWSDPGPSPRTTEQAVAELRRLLDLAGEAPPFVLVGHSFGGFNMRYLAARWPGDVSALVLVDSSHPDELPNFHHGAHRAAHAIRTDALGDPWTGENPFRDVAGFLNSRRKAVFAQMDELQNFALSAAQVRSAGTLSDLPLIVLARGDVAVDSAREAQWRARQHSLAALSSRARLLVAPRAGHDIHLAQPDVVVEAVRGLLDRLAVP